jgi:hypothetical protein
MIPIETYGMKGLLPDVSKIPANTVVTIDLREQQMLVWSDVLRDEFNDLLLKRAEELNAEVNVWNVTGSGPRVLIEFVVKEEK